jgi:membrane associated rhomboid family serine protease
LVTAAAFWLAAVAGGFASEAFGSCVVTVGASGGIFGLLGVFLADCVFHFASVSYPVWRLVSLLIFGVMWLATSASGGGAAISHWSHLAGVIYGAALGPLLLPSLPREWMESAAPLLGVPSRCHLCAYA